MNNCISCLSEKVMLSYNRDGKKFQRRLLRFSHYYIYCIYIYRALIYPDKIINTSTLRFSTTLC